MYMYRSEKWCLLILLLLSILVLTAWVEQGQAQEKYPTRGIEMIAPVSPGGGIDVSGRLLAPYVSKKWGVPVNVVNKPGGNFVNGTLDMYRSAPDGYTVLVDSNASCTIMEKKVGGPKNLPFDIMDRTFISIWGVNYELYFVKKDSPINSLKDLEAVLKKDPENFTWSSVGGALDYVIFQFIHASGVNILRTKPVPASGAGPAIVLVAGGSIVLGAGTVTSCLPSIKSGIIKPLAIVAKVREPELPDLPTVSEVGYPMIDAVQWLGPSGPPKMNPSVIPIWENAIQEMLKDPEMLERMRKVGITPFYLNSRDARAYVAKERSDLDKVWVIK